MTTLTLERPAATLARPACLARATSHARPTAPQEEEQPVFQSTSHALHVAYLIASLPATSRSPTAIVINHLARENQMWDEVQPRAPSRVNFGTLSPLEVRGQCAQVISMVNKLPHPAERDACRAVYGRQAVKAEGVRGMAHYCQPALDLSNDACLYLAWHVFMEPQQREGVTQAHIAEQFGLSTHRVRTATETVRRYGRSLHARALESLTKRFLAGAQGLIPAE